MMAGTRVEMTLSRWIQLLYNAGSYTRSSRPGQMVAVNIKILIGPRVTLNLGLSPSGPATDWNYVMSSKENIGVDITED